jgi:uncharacterized protein (DUF427 family)
MKAVWRNTILAESDETIVVEGNHYFPPESIHDEFFHTSSTKTMCAWKGVASYYDLLVNGATNKDAAWYYAHPSDAALQIKNYVAFWRGVQITT